MQPKIRLTNCVGTHLLPCLLILSIGICDAAVGDGVHDVHPLLAHLACEGLRELAH